MAKQVIWSDRAKFELKVILEYWYYRNKSETYSLKLSNLFDEAVTKISNLPEIGKYTDNKESRIVIVRNYYLVYEELEKYIFILTIWDSRQNPDSLKI